MFSFWSRKGNKSPAAGRTSNILSQSSPPPLDVGISHPVSRTAHLPSAPPQPENNHAVPAPPIQVAPEPLAAAVPNPHDAAIAEVHAKLLQAEQLSSTARPRASTDPLTNASAPSKPPLEPLFDPSTGSHRGFFEPVTTDVSSNCDEVWAHLARIRDLQSEVATMHMHMEGIGDESTSIDGEVDNDVDADTVPTQEEEEAAKREKEFTKLPGRFKGRSDNINAMMAKLDDLSQAVTSFHMLQPPPLNFESIPTSAEIPFSPAARTGSSTPATRVSPDQNQIVGILYDSPISMHPAGTPGKP